MNIVKEELDNLNARLKVTVEPTDYQDKVEKVLVDYRKKASVPGFRPGKVPAGMVRKMYGKSVMVDEVNKILQEGVYKFIVDEKLDILGNPLPVDTDINWDEEGTLEFSYELGLKPEFEVKLSAKDKLTYHKIKADEEMIQRSVEDYTKRFGKMEEVAKSEDKDLLFGEFVQLFEGKPVENGIQHSASLALDQITDEKTKKAFIGKKVGDTAEINVKTAFDQPSTAASLLSIDESLLNDITGEFTFTIEKISRLLPAEMNQDFFDKVYGEGEVKSEKEFRERVAQEIEQYFVAESDRKFQNDCIEYVIDKTKFDMPAEFLKKWLNSASEKPLTFEEIEADYDKYEKTLRWQLLEAKIMEEHGIKLEAEEVKAECKKLITQNFAQYGQPAPEGEEMDKIVEQVLQNEEESRKLQDQLISVKMTNFFKETVKVKEEEKSWDDFIKLANSNS